MATAKNTSPTKLVTGRVRLSYCHLNEPQAFGGQEPKYSVVILIPKSDKITLDKIRNAQRAALEAGKSSKFNGVIPKNWSNTLRDGDEEKDLDLNPEYEGMMFMSVSSKNRPGIVDTSLAPITNPEEIYSGMYARVSINAFPFSAQGNKGVSFGLNNVQKLADGDFLGGRTKAEDDFDEVDPDNLDDIL